MLLPPMVWRGDLAELVDQVPERQRWHRDRVDRFGAGPAARAGARNSGTEGGKCVPKKGQRLLREGAAVVSKYEYIDSQKNEPANTNPVVKMCSWLAVSTSVFYHWAGRSQSATAARREALTVRIKHFFKESDGTYGYHRIPADPERRGRGQAQAG
jgi:hypothetical protein